MFNNLLSNLDTCPRLQALVADVLHALPEDVQQDFLQDASFRIVLEDYTPGTGWKMFMECPTAERPISRCVVLRSRLEVATAEFAQYVIAHEFAHAFLRNGAWGEITDREHAADALAASWGYRYSHFKSFP